MNLGSKILLLSMCVLLQTACSSQAVYTGESFDSDSPFRMRADGEVTMACESARRALLGQGYLIESASSDGVKGRKAYKSDDDQNTFIEMNIVCLPETSGSTLFANGLLSAYELKKSGSSASVGVSALGSISLPIGQSADSLVKVSEETINDKDFYRRFFAAVGNILGEMQAARASPEPEPEPEPKPESEPEPAAPESTLPPVVQATEPAPPQATPPVVLPAQESPASMPELLPEPLVPALTEPVSSQEAAVTSPAPLIAEEESAAVPGTLPEQAEEPVVPEPVPDQDDAAITPQPLPVKEAPAEVVPESTPARKMPANAVEQESAPVPGASATASDQHPDPADDLF